MNNLEKLTAIKLQIRELQNSYNQLLPEATFEALTVIDGKDSKIAYQNEQAKLIVSMREKFPTFDEYPHLEKAERDIQFYEKFNRSENEEEITEIDQQIEELEITIASLEEQKSKLLDSPELQEAKETYNRMYKNLTTYNPVVSIYLR